jgi:transposase-like protein
MSGQQRRRFTREFRSRRSRVCQCMPGTTQSGVARELGVTSSQLKSWRLELEAAGSADAIRRQKAEAALFEYIAIFYNRRRRHSSIGYRTPEQARIDMRAKIAA